MATELPTIGDLPGADVVIFDGNCRFCQAQVARLARWDGHKRLAFLSLHDPETTRRYPDLKHDDLMRQMYVVDQQGRRHGGVAALRYLSLRLPKLWALAPWLHIPGTGPLWRWMYGTIAKRRYRWGKVEQACEDDACRIHMR